MSHDEAEFRRMYVEPEPQRVVAVIDLDTWEGVSPFVEVRYKGNVAFVNPMRMDEYLDLDVHAFNNGEDAPIGVMGMTTGKDRMDLKGTTVPDEDVIGWPAARLIALFIGRR